MTFLVLCQYVRIKKGTRRHSRRFFINGYNPLALAAPERGYKRLTDAICYYLPVNGSFKSKVSCSDN